MLYRIRDWDDIYENNRTRDLKIMQWLPIPIKLSGDGYTLIMEKKNGAAIYGAWIACALVAGRCDPRGTLVRSSGEAHDAASLSRMTRIPAATIKEMLSVCLSECNWLEIINLEQGATIPQEGATIPQEPALNGREGKEGNGIERREEKIAVPAHLVEIWPDYLETRKAKRAANTNHAMKLCFEKLEKLAPGNYADQIEIVKQSIERGYQGLFELSGSKQKPKYGRQEVSNETIKKNMDGFDAIMAARGEN